MGETQDGGTPQCSTGINSGFCSCGFCMLVGRIQGVLDSFEAQNAKAIARAALGRSVPQPDLAKVYSDAYRGDLIEIEAHEEALRAVYALNRRSVPAEPTPEPSEEAVRAAFGVLYGKPPEWELDGQDHTICPRDWERIQEIRDMLRAAYAVDFGAPPQGEPPA